MQDERILYTVNLGKDIVVAADAAVDSAAAVDAAAAVDSAAAVDAAAAAGATVWIDSNKMDSYYDSESDSD